MQKYASFSGASTATRLKLAMYYVQRTVTSRTVRKMSTRALVGALRAFHKPSGSHAYQKSSLADHLKKAGYLELGKLLARDQCDDIQRYLVDKYMVDARGTGNKFRIHHVPQGVKIGDYPLDTIVNCPHVLDIANHPEIIRIVTNYLGFKPTIVSLGLRWSFPTETSSDTVQRFHRDSEPASAKLLIYLTDVDHLSGPHAYVEGTHHERMPLRMRPYSDDDIARRYGTGVVIKGLAGTGFVIDTKGIHKGVPPSQRPRLLLGIQYSLLPCFLYEYSPVACKRADEFDPYINRLMIRDDDEDRGRRMNTANESDPELANSGR
jgi:hypothetical protein